MTFPILQASAAIQTNLKMCSYTYYPLGSQTLKGYLIGNHYPYLMMEKKWQHIIKETTDNVQKVKKINKCSGDVADLCVFCTEAGKSDFPFLKDNIFLPYGNACKKGTNRTYSEVCLEETGINEHCIFGISV